MNRPGEGPGGSPVGMGAAVLLLLSLVAMALGAIWMLQELLAADGVAFSWLTGTRCAPSAQPCDAELVLIVLISGALGGLVHSIRSMVWYVGNRELVWSWVPTYLTLPLVGALLSTVLYLLVRAGFVGFSGTPSSPYGFAAAGALMGMFSQPAILKLKEVAETLFTRPPSGKDSTPQEVGVTEEAGPHVDRADGIAPMPVIVEATIETDGSVEWVSILGTGFRASTTVRANGSPLQVKRHSANALVAELPGAFARPGSLEVEVTTPAPGGGTCRKQLTQRATGGGPADA